MIIKVPLLSELIPFMSGFTIDMAVLTDLGPSRRRLETGMIWSLALTVPVKAENIQAHSRKLAHSRHGTPPFASLRLRC